MSESVTLRWASAVILAFVGLGLAWSASVPVWAGPDEPHHFEYVRFLAEHRRLPNQAVPELATSNEGFKPPLYYALAAALLTGLSEDAAAALVVPHYDDLVRIATQPGSVDPARFFPALNPRYVKLAPERDGARRGEPNMFLRAPGDRFPFEGALRTVHLLRLPSLLMGALTLWLVFRLVRDLLPGDPLLALLATSICAFNPQFTFVHAYLNNDALVILLTTAGLRLLVRYGMADEDRPQLLAALGACIGLGMLTKLNAVLLLPVAAIAVIWRAWREAAPPRRLLRDLSWLGVPVVALAGWYYVRGAMLYGVDDPLGWQILFGRYPELLLPDALRWPFLLTVFPVRLFASFWGLFDWLTVPLPGWAYAIYGGVSALALVGILLHAAELRGRGRWKRSDGLLALLLLAVAIALANLVSVNRMFVSAQGRLVFPVIAPLALFMALGLRGVCGRWLRVSASEWRGVVAGVVLGLAAMNLYALVAVLRPVYD